MEKAEKNGTDLDHSISDSAPIVLEVKESKRSEWGNHCQFFLSSLGLAVGLGNIWRFPYVCYDNGGATFLIPYFIMLFLVGLPMFFLELVLGQYAGLGATKIYGRLTPGLRGLGFGMITIPTLINFYYVVIMAYALHFLFAGFTSTLPWSACGHDYNSDHCYSLVEAKECNINQVYYREKCTPSASFCRDFEYKFEESHPGYCINDTGDILPMADIFYRVSPSEEYWYGRVLHFNVTQGSVIQDESSWDNWGGIQWELVGCLGLGWIIIFIFLNNGIQSYGKVVYFTTLFPYVVLTILLGYVATLDGFDVGMEYYFVPRDWNDLWDISVWNAAAGQIFYSIGVALGTHLMLASYNNFNENVQRDAVLIAVSNSLTSIYAGLVVFGSLGYISIQKGVKIEDVIQSGPGLAFIVYPEAVTLMDVPPLFSFLFFFMVILLAISSVCATWEGMIGTLMDEFPQLRERRRTTVFVSCLVAFLCGLSMCFDSGFLMFFLLDSRVSNAILLLSFIELITISWFYGSDKVMDHVQEMKISMPKVLEWYWKVSWIAVSPAILFAVTVLFWAEGHEDQFLDYVFPTWVQALGWGMELVAVLIIVIGAVYEIVRRLRNGESIAPFRLGPYFSSQATRGRPWELIVPGPLMSPNNLWGSRPDKGNTSGGEGKVNGTSNLGFENENSIINIIDDK